MSNNGNGNFLDLNKEEIGEGIIRMCGELENTSSQILGDQYLAHLEYWERVLREMQ